MVKWDAIASPKEVGGLGIINSRVMNWCLMTKWAWKILTGQGGLWLFIFKAKYLEEDGVTFRPRVRRSQIANDIRKVHPLLWLGAEFVVNNGQLKSFWIDVWWGERSLDIS